MFTISERSEQMAAHLVGHHTGAEVVHHDTDGKQSAVDFRLEWPDGSAGALEVTLVNERRMMAWQRPAMKDGWRWPAVSSWEFRATGPSFPYRRSKAMTLKAV